MVQNEEEGEKISIDVHMHVNIDRLTFNKIVQNECEKVLWQTEK